MFQSRDLSQRERVHVSGVRSLLRLLGAEGDLPPLQDHVPLRQREHSLLRHLHVVLG